MKRRKYGAINRHASVILLNQALSGSFRGGRAFSIGLALSAISLSAKAENNPPTFHGEIAVLVYTYCATCHYPGGAGPFPLTSYEEVKAQGKKIVAALNEGSMPPWLPDDARGTFLDDRRLPVGAAAKIREWYVADMPEGNVASAPTWKPNTNEWAWGKPDLVLPFPEAYEFPAEGGDEYRNFILKVPRGEDRYVRGFQFIPGSAAIHHARFLFDASGESQKRDAADAVCGFAGIMPPARPVPGHILGWTPGRGVQASALGLPWPFDGHGDMVVQLHLQRTGHRETIQPRIGFYFTNQPPVATPVSVGMVAQAMELPAGERDVAVTRSFELPAESDLLAIMPHAHLLATSCECSARLPDGATRTLLTIRRWRFNWQDEYRYVEPISLPAGTVITFKYIFDNSDSNPVNPSHPPKTVRHGPSTTDEMAEMWLQVVPADERAAQEIDLAVRRNWQKETVAAFTKRVQKDPDNPLAHLELARNLGALGQKREAFEELVRAVELDPHLAEAHYYIGVSFFERGLFDKAKVAFEQAVAENPDHQRAHAGVGLAAWELGDKPGAEKSLQRALELNPRDLKVREKLREIQEGIPGK
ncbi:MAG TPA: tetratricopeptide repeat protein [Candidatus Limnocylindria bacterium]|nr:tetratricopeptide repeat protein [Candidatus Limnocylindria bacterium]